MKAPTKAQLDVLRLIKRPRHLSLARGPEGMSYFFNGGGPNIHWATGEALEKAGWIKQLPRLKEQPYWRTDFDITKLGREALTIYSRPVG